MKFTGWILIVMAATALVLSGCNKKSSVDTAPLEKSFASAEPANKSTADQAASDIKAGDYAGAMAKLQKLAAQAKLTPEQQQAVKDVLAQIQKQLSDVATQAGKDAQKAAGDLQKSLPKP
jgi:outer membrane protein assembly factor BamD (BamD/ComL family)